VPPDPAKLSEFVPLAILVLVRQLFGILIKLIRGILHLRCLQSELVHLFSSLVQQLDVHESQIASLEEGFAKRNGRRTSAFLFI